MSVYDYALSDCFPYAVEVKEDVAESWARFLISAEPPATNGSSFAVTSDAKEGYRRFWLSEVSRSRIIGWVGYI